VFVNKPSTESDNKMASRSSQPYPCQGAEHPARRPQRQANSRTYTLKPQVSTNPQRVTAGLPQIPYLQARQAARSGQQLLAAAAAACCSCGSSQLGHAQLQECRHQPQPSGQHLLRSTQPSQAVAAAQVNCSWQLFGCFSGGQWEGRVKRLVAAARCLLAGVGLQLVWH
jgi:hypothetical protein